MILLVSTSVLYLIEDIPQHAQDLKEVLKPGGVYYASFADLTNNPSRQFMDDTINQYGATPSQNILLKNISLIVLLMRGFEVAVMKEPVPDVIDLTHYSDFIYHQMIIYKHFMRNHFY